MNSVSYIYLFLMRRACIKGVSLCSSTMVSLPYAFIFSHSTEHINQIPTNVPGYPAISQMLIITKCMPTTVITYKQDSPSSQLMNIYHSRFVNKLVQSIC